MVWDGVVWDITQGKQAELSGKATEHCQGPVEQQGNGRHAYEVERQPRGEVAPHQPEQKQRQHGTKQQVLAALIAEQFKPGRSPQRPAQDSCIQQPAQPLAGRQQQLAGDHCPSACKAWRNAPASVNWR